MSQPDMGDAQSFPQMQELEPGVQRLFEAACAEPTGSARAAFIAMAEALFTQAAQLRELRMLLIQYETAHTIAGLAKERLESAAGSEADGAAVSRAKHLAHAMLSSERQRQHQADLVLLVARVVLSVL